jgi:hypothetical protein
MNVRQAAQLVPFAGLLLLYAASAPRTVALEDDGAFILAGHFLGVAHPPGYPLHTLLAFLFDQLPLGSAAYRAHLLSGVFGALAAAVLFACTRAVGVRTTLAAGAALAFGLSRVFWSQAIVAEVYTLHVFLFALALLLALRLHRGEGGRGTFVGLAAATGLGLANHWPLMVLAGPALLLLVWRRWREGRHRRRRAGQRSGELRDDEASSAPRTSAACGRARRTSRLLSHSGSRAR